MAKSVWKFPIAIEDQQDVRMPSGAEILSVQFQRDQLCLWALADPIEMLHLRRIYIYGTGRPVPRGDIRFIGTAQQMGGALVWHIFEEILR